MWITQSKVMWYPLVSWLERVCSFILFGTFGFVLVCGCIVSSLFKFVSRILEILPWIFHCLQAVRNCSQCFLYSVSRWSWLLFVKLEEHVESVHSCNRDEEDCAEAVFNPDKWVWQLYTGLFNIMNCSKRHNSIMVGVGCNPIILWF